MRYILPADELVLISAQILLRQHIRQTRKTKPDFRCLCDVYKWAPARRKQATRRPPLPSVL